MVTPSKDRGEHSGRALEIVKQKVRIEAGERCASISAGGDGDGLRADRARTRDIMGRIAENKDPFRRELDAMPLESACASEPAELIAIVMIVSECAELEEVPNAIVSELQFSAARKVAGEQTEHDVPAGLEAI